MGFSMQDSKKSAIKTTAGRQSLQILKPQKMDIEKIEYKVNDYLLNISIFIDSFKESSKSLFYDINISKIDDIINEITSYIYDDINFIYSCLEYENISINDSNKLELGLFIACSSNNINVVKLLIDKGINNDYLKYCFNISAINKRYEIIKLLIEKYYDHISENIDFVLLCILNNNLEIIDLIKQVKFKNKSLNNLPLLVACENGFNNVVKLLAPYSDVDGFYNYMLSTNSIESTMNPLMICSKIGYLSIIKILLDNGADVNKTNSMGENCLFYASVFNHLNIVDHLLYLKKINVNHKNINGETCIMVLCSIHDIMGDYSRVIELLVSCGSDINIKDNLGNTCLIKSFINKNTDLSKSLLYNGADINIKNNDGYSFFHYLCSRGDKYIYEYKYFDDFNHNNILEKVNINEKTNDGNTPLILACKVNNCENIDYLLSLCCSVDEKNNNDETALSISVKNGNYFGVKSLLLNRAKFNGSEFETSLKFKTSYMSRLLLSSGCNYSNVDKKYDKFIKEYINSEEDILLKSEFYNIFMNNASDMFSLIVLLSDDYVNLN